MDASVFRISYNPVTRWVVDTRLIYVYLVKKIGPTEGVVVAIEDSIPESECSGPRINLTGNNIGAEGARQSEGIIESEYHVD